MRSLVRARSDPKVGVMPWIKAGTAIEGKATVGIDTAWECAPPPPPPIPVLWPPRMAAAQMAGALC